MRDGLPDGYWKSYNKKGILASEGNRKDFLLDSLWKFYNDDGKLFMTVNFKQGKKEGLKITYQPNEKIEETYKNNIKIDYEKHYSNSGKLLKIIPFANGLEEGTAKEYDELGTLILITEYQKGYVLKRDFINRTDANGQKQGNWKSFYDNDIEKWEGTYLNNKRNGFFKEFDVNGNLLKIEKYENDVLIVDAVETRKLDMRIDYHKNGNPKIIGTYYNGVAEGVRREYNEKGQVIQSYLMKSGIVVGKGVMDDGGLKQGTWEEFYDETYAKASEHVIKAKGKYKNSKPVGEWSYFYPDGKIEIEGSYSENGKKDGLWTWYFPNGNILIQENYADGNHEGLYTEYDEKKNIIIKGKYVDDNEDGKWFITNKDFVEEGKFVEGKREGFWKGYYKNQNVCYECSYNNNNYDGRYIRYSENGRIKEQGTYILGLRNGSWRSFDEQGNLYLIVTYKMGVEIRFEGVKIEPSLDDKETSE
jgi:antitoxin component YwqK of YwqJK toxin-antitoxin module